MLSHPEPLGVHCIPQELAAVTNGVRLYVRAVNLNREYRGAAASETILGKPSFELTFATLDDLAVAATVVPPIESELLHITIGVVHEVTLNRLPSGIVHQGGAVARSCRRVGTTLLDTNRRSVTVIVVPAFAQDIGNRRSAANGTLLNGSIQFVGVGAIIRKMTGLGHDGVATLGAFVLNVPTTDVTGTAFDGLGSTSTFLHSSNSVVCATLGARMVRSVAIFLVATFRTGANLTVGYTVDAILGVGILLILPIAERVITFYLLSLGFTTSLTSIGLDTHIGTAGRSNR